MSATRLRDQIYSRLHAEVFRPRGFRKTQRWISKAIGRVHFAVDRPQHRYESPDCGSLGLQVYVFHESYHSLMIGWPTFPGVDRMSIPVFRRGLRWLAGLTDQQELVFLTSNAEHMVQEHRLAIEKYVLPLFARSEELSGMLEVVREFTPPSWLKVQTEAGLLVLLGNAQQAREVLEIALERADKQERASLTQVRAKLFNVG
jgi:hypothetical protein